TVNQPLGFGPTAPGVGSTVAAVALSIAYMCGGPQLKANCTTVWAGAMPSITHSSSPLPKLDSGSPADESPARKKVTGPESGPLTRQVNCQGPLVSESPARLMPARKG